MLSRIAIKGRLNSPAKKLKFLYKLRDVGAILCSFNDLLFYIKTNIFPTAYIPRN